MLKTMSKIRVCTRAATVFGAICMAGICLHLSSCSWNQAALLCSPGSSPAAPPAVSRRDLFASHDAAAARHAEEGPSWKPAFLRASRDASHVQPESDSSGAGAESHPHDDGISADGGGNSLPQTYADAAADGFKFAIESSEAAPCTTTDNVSVETASAPACSGIWGDSGCPEQAEPMSRADMDTLLKGRASIQGKVEKSGTLPLRLWLPPKSEPATHEPLHDWIWQSSLGGPEGELTPLPRGVVPPKVDLCVVLINPVYKFIFIKNTKVAGSSVFVGLGGFCPEGITLAEARERGPCFWSPEQVRAVGVQALGYESLEALWADYTVFAIIRNIYDRAASAYDYLLGRRENRVSGCRDPTFQQYAARPYMIGLQSMFFDCGPGVHDLVHVEPQHVCLADDSGDLVVDQVLWVNSLADDFDETLAAINGRRSDGLPALNTTLRWMQKGPLAKDEAHSGGDDAEAKDDNAAAAEPESRHVQKYVECGARCFGLVHDYYKQDFELLKYPVGDVFAPRA